MTYGQTGAGKTFTMVGDDKQPGLYFTAVEEVFRLVKDPGSLRYNISVSVVEIYNEEMRDLLVHDQSNNRFRLLERDGLVHSEQSKRRVTSKN